MSEIRTAVVIAALVILAALMLAPLAARAWAEFRRLGFAFAIIAFGFIHAAATKPTPGPSVTFDEYLADDGTAYTATGGVTNGVRFAWRKTDARLPDATPLHVSQRQKGGASWTLAATTYVGALAHALAVANPTGLEFYVWHEWVPPSPVHTNGVWLGNVLEKANGHGIDRILVIQGMLQENERKLNP